MGDGLERASGRQRRPGAHKTIRAMTVIALGASLAACAVGPDYRTPAPPPGKQYTATPLPAQTVATQGLAGDAGHAQHFVATQDIPGQWWTLFHCAPLDALIRQALDNSPTLAAAQAALRQSQENLNAEVGSALFPAFDAKLGASRQKTSGLTIGQPGRDSIFNLYNASVSVSYSLDLFGGARRQLEALGAQVDYQRYQWQAAYLALTANLVTASIKEASLRAQIEATERIAGDQRHQLDLLSRQFELGGVNQAAVLAQRTTLAQTLAALPPLRQALDVTRHQIAVLAGRPPSDGSLPEFRLSDFSLPQDLPVSLPSALVRQRPDILAADATLHAASAKVGVATAEMYPQLNITGSYGTDALTPAGAFRASNAIWSLGAGLLQPLFHGGQLLSQKRAAEAAYDQAAAQYRQTVLQAFQNVADTLRALDNDAHALNAQADAERAARASLDLSQQQYRLGAVSYLSLLDSQRQYQQSVVNLVQAQAARYADTAALFQAVGGGWWHDQSKQTQQADAAKASMEKNR
ncbi:MAG: efflux transporter outer membrane subunit [Burkholderiales bacterium]|nr:efflux transporter outer membrane subunit [Burkholderiales bacterium]MDE2289422.1 efflux transporter outer membrane subunit [Burkholderiales bacterium]MDE2607933.1 efflux transporter outer membrane subunit [Burkholderiales bacterium]